MIRGEFSLISHYFNQVKISRYDVETGIGDDCALLHVPRGKTLAISTDTLVCNQHFLSDIDPKDLAYKALAVNISDLAAIGADPAWITLSLTLPKINEPWLQAFSEMLFKQLSYYNIELIGGDTNLGPLSITVAIHGFIPYGEAIKRSGAHPEDLIYVTGTLGDSAAGLAILQKQLTIENILDKQYLIKRQLRPTPRIFHGKILRKYASSAIDLSDGLISDIKHILNNSKVGAYINLDSLPLSKELKKCVEPEQALCWALSGGEDYELLFTISELNRKTLNLKLKDLNNNCTCIGKILPKSQGLKFLYKGIQRDLNWKGYEHFT